MKEYKAHEIVTVNSGKVGLNKDQVRRRKHNLKELEDGVYEIINPIQFKKGETFFYDGEVNKKQALSMKDVDEPEEEIPGDIDVDDVDDPELLNILDQSIPDIVESLTEVSDEDLATLEEAEENGKTRKGVIEAIEAERADRDSQEE